MYGRDFVSVSSAWAKCGLLPVVIAIYWSDCTIAGYRVVFGDCLPGIGRTGGTANTTVNACMDI